MDLVLVEKFKIGLLILLVAFSINACSQFNTLLEPEATDISSVPAGEFIGTYKFVKGDEIEESTDNEVKITLFPVNKDDLMGTGILVFNSNSQRFFWEGTGNKVDTWNVLFRKDNNIYTKITTGFNFDGLLKKSDTNLRLFGSLHTNDDKNETFYFIDSYQYIAPKLIAAKEIPSAKPGEPMTIQGEHIGTDKEKVLIKLTNVKDNKEFEAKPERIEDKGATKSIGFKTDSTWPKGDYTLYVVRDGNLESNSISAIIL